MKICVICGEEFADSYENCPVCGCPQNRFTISGLGFPRELERQYLPAGLKEGSKGQRYLLLKSKNTGKTILAGRVREEETGICRLISEQKKSRDPCFPAVYETSRQTGNLFFLFEAIPGETMRERARREYPPAGDPDPENDREFADSVRRRIASIGGGVQPDFGSSIWTEDGFRMRDFGAGMQSQGSTGSGPPGPRMEEAAMGRGEEPETQAPDAVAYRRSAAGPQSYAEDAGQRYGRYGLHSVLAKGLAFVAAVATLALAGLLILLCVNWFSAVP